MQLIRVVFYKSNRVTRRGYRTHVNDHGLPLCREAARKSHSTTVPERCEWVTEFGIEPTCTVCARMVARIHAQGGAR